MRRKIELITTFFIVIAFFSCKKKESNVADIHFEVKQELLASDSIVTSYGISVKTPKGFQRIPQKNAEGNLTKFTDSLSPNTLKNHIICSNAAINSVILISKVIDKNYEDIVKNTIKYSRNKAMWSNITIGEFTNNNLRFNQFVLNNSKHVIFKLLVASKDEISEINYIFPREVYNVDLVKSLESSIGSIHRINY